LSFLQSKTLNFKAILQPVKAFLIELERICGGMAADAYVCLAPLLKMSPHFVIYLLNLEQFLGQVELQPWITEGWTDVEVEIVFQMISLS
jgi:hypothetical protein